MFVAVYINSFSGMCGRVFGPFKSHLTAQDWIAIQQEPAVWRVSRIEATDKVPLTAG